MIVTADHGGGGVPASDHDHPHPINETIPCWSPDSGSGPAPARRAAPACSMSHSTVLSGFGGNPPAQWQGRVLSEAF